MNNFDYNSFNTELQAVQDKMNHAMVNSGKDPLAIEKYYIKEFNKIFNKYRVSATTSVIYT